jgi:SAM-dependent methyltransferase
VIADMGTAMAGLLCAIGVRLGLFAEMARAGAVTSAELAARAGVSERYAREWLGGLASAGYVEADPGGGRFALPPGLAMVLAPGSPLNLAPGWLLLPALAEMIPAVSEAFCAGTGVPPEDYSPELYAAMEQMSAAWFDTMLVQQWLPAVDGMAGRLGEGARVADIGCGHGRALIACARAFPASQFVGYDLFAANIRAAREAADQAGVGDRIRFEQADAAGLTGHYDLVTAFSVLHDAPGLAGLLRAVRDAVAPDGVFLVLEAGPAAGPGGPAGPAATVLYGTSVLYCLPTSLAQGGPGLGTLGLTADRIRQYCGQAGFRSVRPVPQMNPFHALYEIRP